MWVQGIDDVIIATKDMTSHFVIVHDCVHTYSLGSLYLEKGEKCRIVNNGSHNTATLVHQYLWK